jgi:hypothetical protein
MSLPLPSNVVPPRRGPSPPDELVESAIPEAETREEEEEEADEELDSPDQEILKLVTANTPSYRGRWNKYSAEGRTIVGRDRHSNANDDEDDDDDVAPRPLAHVSGKPKFTFVSHIHMVFLGSSQAGIPGSMPINIRPLVNPRANLSLASYRLQTLPATPQVPEPEPEASVPSRSIRRAVYAQRDFQRAIDPGALDFAADTDSVITEEDEDENEEGAMAATGSASAEKGVKMRGGRERALKILHARNDLPDLDSEEPQNLHVHDWFNETTTSPPPETPSLFSLMPISFPDLQSLSFLGSGEQSAFTQDAPSLPSALAAGFSLPGSPSLSSLEVPRQQQIKSIASHETPTPTLITPLWKRPVPPQFWQPSAQQPTCTNLRIRSVEDAHKIFFAICR